MNFRFEQYSNYNTTPTMNAHHIIGYVLPFSATFHNAAISAFLFTLCILLTPQKCLWCARMQGLGPKVANSEPFGNALYFKILQKSCSRNEIFSLQNTLFCYAKCSILSHKTIPIGLQDAAYYEAKQCVLRRKVLHFPLLRALFALKNMFFGSTIFLDCKFKSKLMNNQCVSK